MDIIFESRKKDVLKRGSNCLVYNYFGQITTLSKCHIWYNNKLEYIYPKNIKKQKKTNDTCIIM